MKGNTKKISQEYDNIQNCYSSLNHLIQIFTFILISTSVQDHYVPILTPSLLFLSFVNYLFITQHDISNERLSTSSISLFSNILLLKKKKLPKYRKISYFFHLLFSIYKYFNHFSFFIAMPVCKMERILWNLKYAFHQNSPYTNESIMVIKPYIFILFFAMRNSYIRSATNQFQKYEKFIYYNLKLKSVLILINRLKMSDFLESIRTHFNIVHKDDYIGLTLIKQIDKLCSPNISLEIIRDIKDHFRLMTHIKKQQITIIQSVNFDDQLLVVLANSLPQSLKELSLDFTGCQSLKGSGFLDLFQRISEMEGLTKLSLDLSEVYDINDLVIEGLTMLLQSLPNLKEFYLDLYEIDQVSEQGYMLLAEIFTNLPNLQKLHLDFSANPNLTQDALQLLFGTLPKNITSFSFKILDIEQIGGGSFFKLAEWITNSRYILNKINLTISTFSNLNQKGIYSVLKSISQCLELQEIDLNISNINLPDKMLSYLSFSQKIRSLCLDISCNPSVSDRDLVNLMSKIPTKGSLRTATFNFDFCKKITEDAIEQLVEHACRNINLQSLTLSDRIYSTQFMQNCAQIVKKSSCANNILLLSINGQQGACKQGEKKLWRRYKDQQSSRRKILCASHLLNQNKVLENHRKQLLKLFTYKQDQYQNEKCEQKVDIL